MRSGKKKWSQVTGLLGVWGISTMLYECPTSIYKASFFLNLFTFIVFIVVYLL